MRRLGYVPALDGLRGVAILAVVLFHFFGLPGGFFGVDLFFVLSGYLITTILLEDGRLGRFYVRRARRLLPALALVLLVLSRQWGWTRVTEGGLYLGNAFRAFGVGHLAATPLDHLWSLAEEEQFYLLWPIVLLLVLPRRRHLAVALGVLFVALVGYRIGLVATGAGLQRIYFGPDTHADGLVLGCLAALLRPQVRAAAGRAGLLAIVVLFSLAEYSLGWLEYGLPLFEIAAVLVVLAAADGHLPELTFKPLIWLGLISYSLYLWHQPARFLFGLHSPWRALPAALVLALLSYWFVEKPFRRLVLRHGRTAAESAGQPEVVGVLSSPQAVAVRGDG
jgi:peptidoglycan/LPS O-acetylase OafA/YrhL